MKFKIRFADQIVGFFVIVSLVCLGLVIVMLGRTQRWFARDIPFTTILYTAAGLSGNMAVQYRGFTIGNVRSFRLTEYDNVEVIFIIHEEHINRLRQGSMVELMASPIGLGNQFLFHAGRGEPLEEGAFVPAYGTPEAMEMIRLGLATEPQRDDGISLMISRANSIMDELSRILGHVELAIGAGSDATEIGLIVASIQRTLAGVETLPGEVNQTITEVREELNPILANIAALTARLNDPDGIVYTVLDGEGEVFTSLLSSINSVSAILDNLARTTAFLPAQLPQIAGLITDIRVIIRTAEDVLIAVANNPLLRGGIPERPEHRATGPRDIRF